MKQYLIFAGTTEGRELISFLLKRNDCKITACTATEYGKILLPHSSKLTVYAKRLNLEEMTAFLSAQHFDAVYDTTHPYAVIVSENIQAACNKTNTTYYRIVRPEEPLLHDSSIISVDSVDEAVRYLANTTGNILSTIGSKELSALCKLPDYSNRIYARILSNPQMVQKSFDLGFQGRHLICMQGPFSQALNTALIREFSISYLLTKSSGKLGGFLEKVSSAKETNTTLVVIGRPVKEHGITLKELLSTFM
ncbi:MAG: precorrin-6A reductase [Lachnospiraceae bacterium]|nr:precorrin-6A reductase [Lachnospiraceae bacterium]